MDPASPIASIARASWPELGAILEPHLGAWPRSDRVGAWLREGVAMPSRRRPEDHAALVMLRLGDDAAAWKQLESLGEDGRTTAARLRAVLERPIDGDANRGQLHLVADALDAMPSAPLRARADVVLAQLRAEIAPRPSRGVDSAEAVALIRGVENKRDLPQVAFGSLARTLSYGGSSCLALIDEELRRDPDGRFAFALRSVGRKSESALPGERLGDLIVLLSRYRSAADPKRLDGEALIRSFGDFAPRLLAALDELAKSPAPKEPNLIALGQMVAQIGRRLPKQKAKALADELVRQPGLIPKSNPVLDRLLPHIPDGTLAGQGLIAVQHLLPSVCNLVEACIRKGMRPDQIHLLATPYNSNPLVAAYLDLLGVHVQQSISFGLESRSSEDVRMREISTFLGSAFQGEPPPGGWRLLDDGGLLHLGLVGAKDSRLLSATERERARALCEKHLPSVRSSTEQTTRGLTEIRKHTFPFPTFTVANQPGKHLEGLVIGGVLAQSMYRELVQAGRVDGPGRAPRILNISAGTIGLESARQLRAQDFEMQLYDLDEAKRKKAKTLGFEREVIDRLPDDLNTYDAILSSTGRRALHLLQLADYRGLIGSGSSTTIEFEGQMLGPLGGQLNRGHPINFTGSGYERLSPEQIGATISLLFLGICSDDRGLAPTEQDLDRNLEKVAVDAWMELGGSETPLIDRSPHFDLPRPDQLSAAPTHDEWMTYLANLPRAVTPRPNSTGFVDGVYFFAGDAGEVRCVDTRSGRSFAVPELDRVPERAAPGGYPKERHPTILFDPRQDPPTVRIATVAGERIELGPVHAVDRAVSHYYLQKGGTDMETGLVFDRGDQHLVFWPGRWDRPELLPKPFGADTLTIMESSKRLCCLDRKTGELRYLGEPRIMPPPNDRPLVDVKQILRAKPYGDLLAVGTSASSGKPAVAFLSARGWEKFELPEGAIVHDVHWPGDVYRFSATYTLPGEPVEPENLKEVEFRPLDRYLGI